MSKLGLNIICGPGDSNDLERLMQSVKGPLFDEVIITTTSDDPEVKAVANRYRTKPSHFQWTGHFSDARNYSFGHSTTDYIMWLDADDFVTADNLNKMLILKNELTNWDVVLMRYQYASNPDGTPAMILPRERIVKNDGLHMWREPIHEYIYFDQGRDRVINLDITITHGRNRPMDPKRNLVALEKEYALPTHSQRCAFYYGKELFDAGQLTEGAKVLEPYVDGPPEFSDNKASACIRLGKYYMDRKDYPKAKEWALKGIKEHAGYAELYVLMGEASGFQDKHDEAIEWYTKAFNTPLGQAGMAQMTDFYGFLPAIKLSEEWYNFKKNPVEALKWANEALKIHPGHVGLLEFMKTVEAAKDAMDPYADQIAHLTRCNNLLMLKVPMNQHVVIWTGPAWEPWGPREVDNGMAGSETWATMLGRELVRRDYRVTVYNDLVGDKAYGLIDQGVVYRDYTHMLPDMREDVAHHFISSRTTDPIIPRNHAIRNYVMVHDIWLSNEPKYDIKDSQVHSYAYLSEWHKEFLIKHHRIPEEKMFLTNNGVEQGLYWSNTQTKTNSTVYSSSPDRGLNELLDMWPRITAEVPDALLYVAYGFSNWELMCKQRNLPTTQLEALKAKIAGTPGVKYLGRIPKEDLARLQLQAKAWLYPTAFTETFSVTAVENGLARNAILTTELAGLTTTVGKSGTLIRGHNQSKEYQDTFVTEAIRLFKDEPYRKAQADKAEIKASAYTWAKACDTWTARFQP